MTGPPMGYYGSCVPRALSSLTGLSIDMVSRALWAAHCARPWAPGAGGPHQAFGTDVVAAIDVATYLWGVRAALTSPVGLSAAETGRRIADMQHERVRTIQHGGRPDVPAAPARGGTLVRDWTPEGAHLLCVDVPDYGGHAVAWLDGRIVAGGERCADLPVEQGWEIFTQELRT